MKMKYGRKQPIAVCPRLFLKKYMKRALPTPTLPFDFSPLALAALRDIYMNDQLGCCVISGGYHVRGVTSGNAGNLFVATNQQIISDYGAIGGYVPGNPNTDQGCDEQTAVNYWTQHGFQDGVKLAGWMAIDPNSISELQTAMWLFENLYFGFNMPNSWVNPQPQGDGFVWDATGPPVPANGHCVMGKGSSAQGIEIDTWGMFGTLTWAAIAKYCTSAAGGNVYVLLSPDMILKANGKAPSGIDWPTLVQDFDSMGGNITPVSPMPPDPTPPPTPIPTPIPVNPPTPVTPPSPGTGPTLQTVTSSVQTSVHAEFMALAQSNPHLAHALGQIDPYIEQAAAKGVSAAFSSGS